MQKHTPIRIEEQTTADLASKLRNRLTAKVTPYSQIRSSFIDSPYSKGTSPSFCFSPLARYEFTFPEPQVLQRKTCLLYPEDTLKSGWDCLIGFVLVYTALVMPFCMAFLEIERWSPWFLFELTIDFLFFADILFNCCTAYYDSNSELVTSRRKIILHYAKFWLLIDILACIPFDLLDTGSNDSPENYNNFLKLLRVPRLYRLFRLSRLAKMMNHFKNSEFFEKLQNSMSVSNSSIKLLRSLLGILLTVHIFSCLWGFSARLDNFHPDTWVSRYNYDPSQSGVLYMASVYWCLTSLGTVGYGDIHPVTHIEIILAICWMIGGVYIMANTITSMTSLLSLRNSKEELLTKKLAAAESIVNSMQLDRDTLRELRAAIKYASEKQPTSLTSKQTLFNELPRRLRQEVAMKMYKGATTRLFFFKNRDPALIAEIALLLKPNFARRSCMIYKEGDSADEVYFLVKGRGAYVHRGQHFTLILKGGYFGEIELIQETRRKYGVRALTNCELLVMCKNLMKKLRKYFSSVWNDMKRTAEQRAEANDKSALEIDKRQKVGSAERGSVIEKVEQEDKSEYSRNIDLLLERKLEHSPKKIYLQLSYLFLILYRFQVRLQRLRRNFEKLRSKRTHSPANFQL